MKETIDIVLSPKQASDAFEVRSALEKKSGKKDFDFKLIKRSIDARSKQPRINLRYEIYMGEQLPELKFYIPKFSSVRHKKHIAIAGCGPAGLFAALTLIERGIKPVIFERGKNVRERRHDLANLNKHGIVNPESNYCYGEGGAGTYSDGKLYTRSDKRGDVKHVL